MKRLYIILASLIILFTSTGCYKYLDVNQNEDTPDYVEAYLYLPGIISSFQAIYYDICALGPMTQMMGTTVAPYRHFGNNYFASSSDAGGEIWRVIYFLHGMNLENMIKQSIEAENWTLVGIGYAIKAYSWDMLTKYHGELPLKQAFIPGLFSHDYDSQEEVYAQVRLWALDAIKYLEMEDKSGLNTHIRANNIDLIYKGNSEKWIKFAHSVIVRNLSSLTNKSNFATEYAPKLLEHAALAMIFSDDDAKVLTLGGGAGATHEAYNNFWGIARANLREHYFPHEYAVQVFTGTVPMYDVTTGDKVISDTPDNEYRQFKLAENQIISDTLVKEDGHFDPRVVAKIGTGSNPYYKDIDDKDFVKAYRYLGGSRTSRSGPLGEGMNFYGRRYASAKYDGEGRWLYRDNAPYILMTAAEIKFCVAETLMKLGRKSEAMQVWKDAIALDMDFTAIYLHPGSYAGLDVDNAEIIGGGLPGGDKITVALFNELAAEYLAGPYVAGLSEADFSLSHIMMQKWVALYPWGAQEIWVDQRKHHFDVKYTGEYPSHGNGWTQSYVEQKSDDDVDKVYKGFYLYPAIVEDRKTQYNEDNEGSPAYRVRPRYNSEYMWNIPSLEKLKPISGTSMKYHTSIPWFVYTDGYPTN